MDLAARAWIDEDMQKPVPDDAESPLRIEDIGRKTVRLSVLFCGMLNPLISLTMKGVIWYQGEDNYNRAHTYADIFCHVN